MLYRVASYSQSPLSSSFTAIDPGKFSAVVKRELNGLEEKVVVQSERVLQRLLGQEQKIYGKLLRSRDSMEARLELEGIQTKYRELKEKICGHSSIAETNIRAYIPQLDTLNSVLRFLDQNNTSENLKDAIAKIGSFNEKLQLAQEVKDFIRERRELLQQKFQQLGLIKKLRKFNNEVYIYSERLKSYKEILSDRKKIEKNMIALLSDTRVFQDFMRGNSTLASLFILPGGESDPGSVQNLGHLQTRMQVNNLVQQQISTGGPNAQSQFRQRIEQGQSQLNELKEKIIKHDLGKNGSSDDVMPNGFKPANQKATSFLKRLEYGANIQAQRSTNFFPTTTDLGLSIGYKLNDKSIIGLGAAYKVGLGRGWNSMELSSQGAGVRSYVDLKLKGSIWISGGYEMNYRSTFSGVDQLRSLSSWQKSGLMGLSKMFEMKSKYFKKTKLQLLWDFLSYEQVPRTQAILFRIEYGFK